MSKLSSVPGNPLTEALQKTYKAFVITFLFSFAVNFLMLLTPLYSLQVLDRVMSGRSVETLVMLTLVMLVIYIALTLLQVARSFVLIKIGEWLDRALAPLLFAHGVAMSSLRSTVGGSQYMRDLDAVKNFLTSIGINSLFDAPWTFIYLIVLFIIHPYLGYLTILGAIIILAFAFLNAYATNAKLAASTEHNIKSMNLAEIATRNAEVVEAMGMINAVVENWRQANEAKMQLQSVASYRNGIISNISKFVRMILQMAVTGIGAYLALKDEMTVGGMIASSILVGRALSPFDAAIETWKQITAAQKAYQRLQETFNRPPLRPEAMSLPAPMGNLLVENIFFAPASPTPQSVVRYTLKGVTFALEAGDVLAIIGPSAAGKTSLAKLITGVWKPMSGAVRLDGADVFSWNRHDFGKYVGYMPQGIELFSGTIRDNIARLQTDVDPEEIVKAAQIAGVHEMILRLPNGYETDIGIGGSMLSAGQRQRVALARAFFGNPKLVVLDEPNANLDDSGEQALVQAVLNAKANKITTILISHRPSILSSVDKILILQDGIVAGFGPRNEILARLAPRQPVIPQNNE